jgi:hypothetical protein
MHCHTLATQAQAAAVAKQEAADREKAEQQKIAAEAKAQADAKAQAHAKAEAEAARVEAELQATAAAAADAASTGNDEATATSEVTEEQAVPVAVAATASRNGDAAADVDLRDRADQIAREALAAEAGASLSEIRLMQLEERKRAQAEHDLKLRIAGGIAQMPVPRLKAFLKAQRGEYSAGMVKAELASAVQDTLSHLPLQQALDLVEQEAAAFRKSGGGFGGAKTAAVGAKTAAKKK